MSYSELLNNLAYNNDLPLDQVHPMDEVLLVDIIKELPSQALVAEIMLALNDVHEVMRITYNHHPLTAEHMGRVGRLSAMLAQKMGLPWKYRLECLFGGWIHDIGKMKISAQLLDKPGKLTKEEYDLFKMHVQFGADMLHHYPRLKNYSTPLLYHHERYDGTGYPFGHKENNIPMIGRIAAVVDAYDAMTTLRPYSVPKTYDEAVTEINRSKRSHFDPEIADIFIKFTKDEIRVISSL